FSAQYSPVIVPSYFTLGNLKIPFSSFSGFTSHIFSLAPLPNFPASESSIQLSKLFTSIILYLQSILYIFGIIKSMVSDSYKMHYFTYYFIVKLFSNHTLLLNIF